MNGLSILVVNYNGASFLRNAILSFQKAIVENMLSYEYLIYDNASDDQSVKVIDELKEELEGLVTSFYSKVNHGFAKANNILSKHAKYQTLVFLNNDTLTINNDELCRYTRESKIETATVYTCKILNSDGTIQRNVFLFPKVYKLVAEIFLLKSILLRVFQTKIDKEANLNAAYFSGCYFIMSKFLFEKVGGFDELFFFYHEECDLFIRLNSLEVKRKILNDTIIHYGSGGNAISDFGFKNYYANLCRLFIKHKYAYSWFIKIVFVLAFNLRILLLSMKININYSPFSQNYTSNYKVAGGYRRFINLHRSTLKAIINL